jgi:hypothetical protein
VAKHTSKVLFKQPLSFECADKLSGHATLAQTEEQLRILYRDIDNYKQMAKILTKSVDRSLMRCQEALAKASGYRDVFEMRAVSEFRSGLTSIHHLTVDEKVQFILSVSKILQVGATDVQYAVSQMSVFQWQGGIREQLEIRAKILRQTSLPDLGRRQPGSVGRLKYNGHQLILRSFGSLVSAVHDGGSDFACCDFEFVTPKKPLSIFVPGRLYYAYGAWTEADGSRVLYSRDYLPMWRIRQGQPPERVNPADWIIHDSALDQWFWGDEKAPWNNKARQAQEIARLESFGVTGLPYSADLLEDLVLSPRPLTRRYAAKLRFGATSNRPPLNDQTALSLLQSVGQ